MTLIYVSEKTRFRTILFLPHFLPLSLFLSLSLTLSLSLLFRKDRISKVTPTFSKGKPLHFIIFDRSLGTTSHRKPVHRTMQTRLSPSCLWLNLPYFSILFDSELEQMRMLQRASL